jgi:phosphoribosylformimino-5-aminoimidazole carboxamide ribotide isomerase
MIVYPTLEILDGKCVSLNRGRLDEPEIWHVDPVKTAREFADAGAEWMQITDFNAIMGNDDNADLIAEIIRTSGLSVQLAGGFRTLERIEHWIDQGAGRIVISTAAVKNPELVKRAARLHAEQIVVSLDVFNGKILTDGWREETVFGAEDFLKTFEGVPLAGVIFTDVNADIDGLEVVTSEISALSQVTRLPLIASGLVRTLDDVSVLKYAGHVSGAIIGRALFNKTVDLGEAIDVASSPAEKIAEFI